MSDTQTVLVIVDIVVIVVLLAAAIWRRNRWEHAPRPYTCLPCRVDYTTPEALAWHIQGQHGWCNLPENGDAKARPETRLVVREPG